jgi:hypothetical protein
MCDTILRLAMHGKKFGAYFQAFGICNSVISSTIKKTFTIIDIFHQSILHALYLKGSLQRNVSTVVLSRKALKDCKRCWTIHGKLPGDISCGVFARTHRQLILYLPLERQENPGGNPYRLGESPNYRYC